MYITLFPCKIRFIVLMIEHNCDPSDGSSNGKLESVCQPVHHDPSASFKYIWCSRPFLSVLEEWCGYRGVIPAPGVTAAIGTNVQGVTHNGESITPQYLSTGSLHCTVVESLSPVTLTQAPRVRQLRQMASTDCHAVMSIALATE